MNIVATNHALDRWRERVAIYGDETIINMRARLNEAISLQGEIPQGVSTYKIGSVVFILDAHNSLCQIVTVIDESVKIPIKKEWIFEGGFEQKDGYESFKKLNSTGNLPEIIFTVNDRVALGAYKAAKEAGLRIPEDLGIFGFGFSEITDFFDPQLTVINQDPRKLGLEAIRLLINEIEKKTENGLSKIFIEEEFLWRKSVKRKME